MRGGRGCRGPIFSAFFVFFIFFPPLPDGGYSFSFNSASPGTPLLLPNHPKHVQWGGGQKSIKTDAPLRKQLEKTCPPLGPNSRRDEITPFRGTPHFDHVFLWRLPSLGARTASQQRAGRRLCGEPLILGQMHLSLGRSVTTRVWAVDFGTYI